MLTHTHTHIHTHTHTHTHTRTESGDSVFDGPITNLFSILCILIEIFSLAYTQGGKHLMVSYFALSLLTFLK